MRSTLVLVATLAGAASVASAEPVRLSDAQLDRITAGMEAPATEVDPIASIVRDTLVRFNEQAGQRLQTIFGTPTFQQGVAVLDPNRSVVPLIRGFKQAFVEQLEITLGIIDLATGGEIEPDNGIEISRPSFGAQESGSSSGGVFDPVTGRGGLPLVGSSLGRIPVIVPNTPPGAF